jgi:tetratricopeptide (TPR) repeat protein
VRAGLRLAGLALERGGAEQPFLPLRIGIASGLVVIGGQMTGGAARERAIVGEPPNLAHRLQRAAEPGSVVIAHGTRTLVRGLFEYRDLGSIAVAGCAEPVRAWQVVRPSAVASRFEALHGASLMPLVGRGEEIALLRRRWQRTKTGRGEVVLLSGEPGIGKSRLTVELQRVLAAELHRCIRYFCAPHYVDSALRPVVQQLERAAGFKHSDAGPSKRQKLRATLSRATSREDISLLSDLLSLGNDSPDRLAHVTPQQKKQRTLEAVICQLEHLSRKRPVLVIVEDLHWLDPSSRELLDLTVERIGSLPVLLVATARPEFKTSWTGQPHVTTLALNPLDRCEGTAMIASLAGGKPLPPEVTALLIERTDGVPLYVEELTKTVLESGLLSDRGDRYVLTAPLPPLAIPTTLQASLMARLDRLASVKNVAQTAAAIGREFSYALIAAVAAPAEPHLLGALTRLVDAGLLFRRGAPPEATFIFKHALLQDAAYASMLKDQRQQLHRRIARALEEQFPRVADVEPETLARHYAEAGLRDKAIENWERAGHLAAKRLAWREATAHFREAVRLTLEMPESAARRVRELALRLPLGHALYGSLGGAPEAEAAYAGARDLARGLGDHGAFCRAVMGMANIYGLTARIGENLVLGQDAIAFAGKDGPAMTRLVAHRVLGMSHWHRGELLASERHYRHALAIARQRDAGVQAAVGFTSNPVITLPVNAAVPLWALGYHEKAMRLEKESLSKAARADPNTLGFTMAWAIFVALLRRDAAVSMQRAADLVRFVEEKGARYFAGFATWGHGAALAISGRPSAALEQMQAGARRFLGTGGRLFEPYLWMWMAEAHLLLQQADASAECLERSRQCIEKPDQRFYEPEMHRIAGALWRHRGDSGRAEASYARAIDVARCQSARSWELRAAAHLARLWRDTGKTGPARDLLAPVYGWFPEGVDTPDLNDAKTLLETLG